MKCRVPLTFSIACATVLLGMTGPRAAGCDPVGNVQFICGAGEDVVAVPDSDWVVTSGNLHLINTRDPSRTVLFSPQTTGRRPDTKTYDSCPGPLDPAEKGGRAHGISVRAGKNGVHTLYAVHHGSRESIEVYELDVHSSSPTLTWIGCAILPPTVNGNAVTFLPEGGFAATNFLTGGGDLIGKGGAAARARLASGNTGEVWEWHTQTGWKKVPGSEAPGPNGIEVSKDGKWLFIGAWGNGTVIRLSRGLTPVKRDVVSVGFHVDNVHWTRDGSLYAAGQGGSVEDVLGDCLGGLGPDRPRRNCSKVLTGVAKIDPNTLKAREVVHYPANDVFYGGTTAIDIGNEIWVTGSGRIGRFPAP